MKMLSNMVVMVACSWQGEIWGGSATAEASYSQSVLGYMRLDQSQASIYIKIKTLVILPKSLVSTYLHITSLYRYKCLRDLQIYL